MMILDKKQMTEEDIKLQFITPAIVSRWTLDRITMETKITDGQVNLKGNFVFMSVIMYRLKKNGRAAVILPGGAFLPQRRDRPRAKRNNGEAERRCILRKHRCVFAG